MKRLERCHEQSSHRTISHPVWLHSITSTKRSRHSVMVTSSRVLRVLPSGEGVCAPQEILDIAKLFPALQYLH